MWVFWAQANSTRCRTEFLHLLLRCDIFNCDTNSSLSNLTVVLFDQLTDLQRFYIASDNDLMIDIFKSELNFLKSSWQNMLGRPLVVMALRSIHLGIFFYVWMFFTH